ncbi:APC family permease [Tumebacillus permanentifrigoris]|uniref:Amino acid/polyamine/organocation transporter (APC superfamily) n=1 Tax=Tumebacillus permanentifrigoris TaxID=378543 RepID=A0A316D6F5_9BACL|nr:amino acid permease [Tumebacillus permanentifrigoris]PWK10310.1 amino acid/polyamine/organocation transporter (APC superfamily) [Tumebacillus permanentifrigoris]
MSTPHRPSITFIQGIALYMGAVLGSGILILPGYTVRAAGPAAIISWLLLSLLSFPLAYTFARLALRYQDLGGISVIVKNAFGRTMGAIVGWYFFTWVSVGQAVVGVTGASYIASAFHLGRDAMYLLSFLFLVVAVVTALLGMKAGGNLSLILSGMVLILLVATVLFSLPHVESANFAPFTPHGLSGIGTACVLIFWAFFGWESITHLVPEFQHPQRDVMRSTWISVVLIGTIYTLLAFVTIGTGTSGDGSASSAPLAVLMSQALGVGAGVVTAVITCIVCLGTLNVYLASSSRLGYALARDGVFPRWFEKKSGRDVPHRSVWFLFVTNSLTLGVCYLWDLSIDKLILVPVTLGILVYVITTVACVKLLWHDPVGRWTSILSALFCLAVAPFAEGYLIVPVLVTGACLLYLRRRYSRDLPRQTPM